MAWRRVIRMGEGGSPTEIVTEPNVVFGWVRCKQGMLYLFSESGLACSLQVDGG
jgi:hypothetical protein